MNSVVISMLQRYKCVTVNDFENALKEIIQEIALLGLWRSKFFEHAAFYGGTALRILNGLDRFSEDLDFSLLKPQSNFSPHAYLNAVEAELEGMGFSVMVEEREKSRASQIESTFIKAGTSEHLIKIRTQEALTKNIPKNKFMQVKFEVDTDPPGGFDTESKTVLQPIPFSVNTYCMPDLFAGKVHALLHRRWKNRVKGRDYYDFVWYISRGIPVHLQHLEERLRQSGAWVQQRRMKESDLFEMLDKRFCELDVNSARNEVRPFLRDPAAVEIWSNEFFCSLLEQLRTE